MRALKRIVIKIGYPILRLYWFFVRLKVTGAKCLLVCGDEVLLIRHSYLSQWWSLSGGKVKGGERPADTAVREVKEELGISLPATELLGTLYTEREYKKATVHVFYAAVGTKSIFIDDVEIIDAQWFGLDNLPENLGWLPSQAIKMYRGTQK